jgi:hypothetical protein
MDTTFSKEDIPFIGNIAYFLGLISLTSSIKNHVDREENNKEKDSNFDLIINDLQNVSMFLLKISKQMQEHRESIFPEEKSKANNSL